MTKHFEDGDWYGNGPVDFDTVVSQLDPESRQMYLEQQHIREKLKDQVDTEFNPQYFLDIVAENANNDKLSDAEFREFILNTLPLYLTMKQRNRRDLEALKSTASSMGIGLGDDT